jgi:SlyX protein
VSRENELGARIVDLELRFMKQERLLDDLNDVVIGQRREIDRLGAEVKALREQLLAGVSEAANERPPHY